MNEEINNYIGLETISNYWGWFLALSILLMILGIAAIIYATTVTLVTVVVFGILLVASGIIQLILAAFGRQWRGFWWSIFIGLLNIIVGSWIILQPTGAAVAITLLIAIFLIVSGIFRIIMGINIRKETNVFWLISGGIISILLGILIWAHWPAASLLIIGLYVGIDIFLSGWYLMYLSLAAKAAKKTPTTAY